MTTLRPDMHEKVYQKVIKEEIERALGEMGLKGYTVSWDPYINRGDLFVVNEAQREILVVEVKKTKQDVLSPRYWDQARKYVLNSVRWAPDAPKVFCVTNAEELCVFCLREDFEHIKYCLLRNGRISNGNFGENGEADEVLERFKESIKGVLRVCLGDSPLEYDENWYPILEKFRVELGTVAHDIEHFINRETQLNQRLSNMFEEWANHVLPTGSLREKRRRLSEDIAASLLFKALSYEVIRNLLSGVPLNEIRNVRLLPVSTAGRRGDVVARLAELFTDILRIDYKLLFDTNEIHSSIRLSQAGVRSLSSFIDALSSVVDARQEVSDGDFIIESLVSAIVPPNFRHDTGLTVEDKGMANLLATICIDNHGANIVDIAAGTCAILAGAYDRLKRLKRAAGVDHSHKAILRQLSAVESNEFIARLGALRFALKNLLEETDFDLHVMDAFRVDPSGDKEVVLCNPPYVRQADIPPEYKIMMRQRIVEEYHRQGVDNYTPYSIGQADKYFYFVEWGMLFLRPGGVAGFILSDKFLDNKNGTMLKRFLLEQTKLKAIIKYSGRYFEGFKVTTCFVIAERKSKQADPAENLVRFIRLHEELPVDKVLSLLSSEYDENTPEARVVIARQGELRAEEKWGKKLLDLPPCYRECYRAGFMVPLREVFGGIAKRGKDNGCNAVFFPTSTRFTKGRREPQEDFERRRRNVGPRLERLVRGIEERFLKGAINNAALLEGFELTNDDITRERLLVVPPETDLRRHRGLRDFLEFAQEDYTDSEGTRRALLDGNPGRIPDRPTIRNRRPWYSLYRAPQRENNYALIIPRMHRATFKVLVPTCRVYFSTNFVGFGQRGAISSQDIKFIAGFLLSSLGQLQFEAQGDWREGLLKIEAGTMYELLVPEPSRVAPELRERVVEAFEDLRFGFNGLEKPGEDNPRFNLDKAVMRIFYQNEECCAKAVEIEEALYQIVLERDPRNEMR